MYTRYRSAAQELTNFPKKGDNKKVTLRNSKYPQADYNYCLKIKEEYPTLWSKGGNIRGNEAFQYWGKVRKGQITSGAEDWIREREAWFARHYGNKSVKGVIAWLKWGGYGQHGESGVKEILGEEMRKIDDKKRKNSRFVKFANPTSLSQLNAIKSSLAEVAQAVYDEWDQDEDGHDEEFGSGGICDVVAAKMADVVQRRTNLAAMTLHNSEIDHTFVLAYKYSEDPEECELYQVDIPYQVYETGGYYKFKKIPDVEMDASDVVIKDWTHMWDDFFDEQGEIIEF